MITVRLATEADDETITKLWNDTSLREGSCQKTSAPKTVAQIAKLRTHYDLYIAEIENALAVGFYMRQITVNFWKEKRSIHLHHRCRTNEVYSALIAYAHSEALKQGCTISTFQTMAVTTRENSEFAAWDDLYTTGPADERGIVIKTGNIKDIVKRAEAEVLKVDSDRKKGKLPREQDVLHVVADLKAKK